MRCKDPWKKREISTVFNLTSYSNSKQENVYFYTEIWTLPLSTVLGFVCTLIDLLGGFLPPNYYTVKYA
jgi:hypothetical protein